jgi:bifunctional polynucleotide phosphatase/kinase
LVFQKKCELIHEKLNVPFTIIASIEDDINRKPRIGMTKYINGDIMFFVGDAAGRRSDFSDTDYKFALNCKIPFYTPEQYFEINSQNEKSVNFDPNTLEKIPRNFNIDYPDILLFVGMPASGKSSVAKKFQDLQNYAIVNQDALKTKQKCLKEFENQLKSGTKCIIDNTNPDFDTRKLYINLAKKYNVGISCINFNTPIEICQHNNYYRYLVHDKKKIPRIAYNIFKSKYTCPTTDEGFEQVIDMPFQNETSDSFWYMYWN